MDIEVGVNLTHLFKVRKTTFQDQLLPIREILLCGKESIDRQKLGLLLWKYTDPVLRPRVALVSKWNAHTRSQFEAFSKLWPVKAKPEKRRYAPHCLRRAAKLGRFLGPKVPAQVVNMTHFLAETIRVSQQVYVDRPAGLNDLPIATLVVDPTSSRILAATYDTRISSQNTINHSIISALKLLAVFSRRERYRQKHYASGYDFYTTHEPCMMCCMAMIHSRVRRCIYWKPMAYTGGKSLAWSTGKFNHKYMVFQFADGEGGEEVSAAEVQEDIPWDVCA
jgi:tRNA(Arg) A34 adenosine deaminase TadA